MRETITRWVQPIADLAFPPVCACCGEMLILRNDVICDECIACRFEADVAGEEVLLPDSVRFRFAMWKFDKLGYLQDLLHKLKYDHLTGIGRKLGRETGRQLIHAGLAGESERTVLVPVPLHHKRHRQRGYNQSRLIAEGIAGATGCKVIAEGAVRRRKNTTTQTGLNSHQRIKNLEKAFIVHSPEELKGFSAIVVDDVFTTGATTFELAGAIYRISGIPCGIVTIART